jgi:hypothetical protein
MTPQADLFFNSDLPELSPGVRPSGSQALQIDTLRNEHKLSPTQKRFNKLLGQIQVTNERIARVRDVTDRHRPRYNEVMVADLKRNHAQLRAMALGIEARLPSKGLTTLQKFTATQMLVHIAEVLSAAGHSDMVALHDRYSQRSMDEKERDALDGLKARVKSAVGGPFGDNFDGDGDGDFDEMWNPGNPFTGKEADDGASPFDEFQAFMQSLRQQVQDRADAAQANADAKQAAKKTKKNKPSKAEEARVDAQTTLRALYRQLASALHPDRETDPQERERKTALMSEVNAAYQKRDLMALMQLQLRVQLVNPQDIAKMADKKVAAFNLLLKEQLAALDDDWYRLDNRLRDEFEIPPYVVDISTTVLDALLIGEQRTRQVSAKQVDDDIEIIQGADLPDFKRWLAEQRRMERQRLREMERYGDFDGGEEEFYVDSDFTDSFNRKPRR